MTGSAPPTVGPTLARATELLRTSGSETPRLDAEVLLGNVLGVDRSSLAAHPTAPLGIGQVERFEANLERRLAGEPVAYIRGIKEFYGVAISVDARVLIPRPETETLVSLAIDRVRDDLTGTLRPKDVGTYRVWDIGTGSGAIPVAMATELRKRRYGDAVHFYLSDASVEAIAVAKLNAVSHGVADLMTFAEGDLAEAQPTTPGPTDLVLANLPYVPSGAMASLPVATSFEPSAALDGGADGLDVIRRLLPELASIVAPGGAVMLEIGGDQDQSITAAVTAALPTWVVTIHADLSGSPRVAQLEPPHA